MEVLKFLEQNDLEAFKEEFDILDLDVCDQEGKTILHHAVSMNKYPFVDSLIYMGADPNIRDKKGNTSLHIAADKDAVEIFELLLEYGGDLDLKNNSQRTAEQIAKISKSKRVLKIISGIVEEEYGHREKIGSSRRWEED